MTVIEDDFKKTIPFILKNIRSTNKTLRLESVKEVRKALSVSFNPPIQEIIDLGLVPILKEYLLDLSDPMIQYESSWALTNIASGDEDYTTILVDYEIHKSFMDLLCCDISVELIDQNIWAIGNIIGESAVNRDLLLAEGIIDRVREILNKYNKESLVSNISWIVSNLCRGSPKPEFSDLKPLLPIIKDLLNSNQDKEEVLSNVLWAYGYITDNPTNEAEVFDCIIRQDVVSTIIDLLSNRQSESILSPGFHTLGNLLAGSDSVTQELIDQGVLSIFPKFLNHKKTTLVKESFWALSNITSGTIKQIQSVIDEGLLDLAIRVGIKRDHNIDINREILFTVTNAVCGGSSDQIKYLVKNKCAKLFEEHFESSKNHGTLFSCLITSIATLLKDALVTIQSGDYQFFVKYYSRSFLYKGILKRDFGANKDLVDSILEPIDQIKEYLNNLDSFDYSEDTDYTEDSEDSDDSSHCHSFGIYSDPEEDDDDDEYYNESEEDDDEEYDEYYSESEEDDEEYDEEYDEDEEDEVN